MISLFIDANVYLRFYAYTDDDLIELEKLEALCDAGELKIYTNSQLIDEFERNRENKIDSALDVFKKSGSGVQIPRFALHFQEAQELLEESKKLQKCKSALSQKISDEIADGDLRADKLVRQIFSKATNVPLTEGILNAARWRQLKGNPPGKRDSLGDQIHWESLIAGVPDGQNLHIVSMDADFLSKLNPGQANPRLAQEWLDMKEAALSVYSSLGSFAKEHFGDISLPSDVTKSAAISKLVTTTNFENTHRQIKRLESVYDDITSEEAQIILQAIVDNNQIRWIADDSDVKEFYGKL